MRTPVFIKSMCPNTGIYTWQAGGVWDYCDAKIFQPATYFLANQVGMQVGCLGAVDVDRFQGLLGGLPMIHSDLYLDAVEVVGLRNVDSVNPLRWLKLQRPRPAQKPAQLSGLLTLYAKGKDGVCYQFDGDTAGHGGWFVVPQIPDVEMVEEFPMWSYTVYVPKSDKPFVLPAHCCKRLVTSTFDNLFLYDTTDASLMSYLIYAQPMMRAIWERRKDVRAHDNKGPNKGVRK